MTNSADSSFNDEGDYLDETGANERKPKPIKRKPTDKGKGREALSRLPIGHLIRHYLLFAFAVLFLLTLARAGYNIWQLHMFEDVNTLLSSFLFGLRFDVALIGILLAVPVFIVPLLAMFRWTRMIAKGFSILWLILALAVVLLLELITPYTVQTAGLRPDLAVLTEMGNPVDVLAQLWSKYIIPASIGVLLALLIFIAFWSRLETTRFLRHPVKKLPAIAMSILGLALCLYAARSSINPITDTLTPQHALISAETTVNELTLNSAYKSLFSVMPTL